MLAAAKVDVGVNNGRELVVPGRVLVPGPARVSAALLLLLPELVEAHRVKVVGVLVKGPVAGDARLWDEQLCSWREVGAVGEGYGLQDFAVEADCWLSTG